MTTETETELGNVVAFPLADESDPKAKVNVPAAGTPGNPWTTNPSDGTIAANAELFGNNPVLRQFYS